MSKTAPCKDGQRHEWAFVRNKNVITSFDVDGEEIGTRVSIRGVYKCAVCGARKYGVKRDVQQ